MNQTKTTTSQEQLTKSPDLVMKERALNELMAINEAFEKQLRSVKKDIEKYKASKDPQPSSITINPSGIATALQSLERELNKGVDYHQLPYRHSHNCIFPNGEQEVNRVWHSCL